MEKERTWFLFNIIRQKIQDLKIKTWEGRVFDDVLNLHFIVGSS